MCYRETRVWLGFALLALIASGSALAQAPTPPITSINTVQCAALTMLAPAPEKMPVDMATTMVAAAVKAAMIPNATAATVEAATKIASRTVASEINSAAFKLPQPRLKQGVAAEWGSRIEMTFEPVDAPVAKCLESDLTLFLDHYPLAGLTPVERLRDANGVVTLVFHLNRPATLTVGWTELLANLWEDYGTRSVTVGVGPVSTEVGIAKESLKLTLGTGGPRWAWVALIGSLILLGVLWKCSKLLHDRRDGPMSYSLSRLLLSFWLLTTTCAVLLMVLRTGVMPSANESGIAFMLAISGATAGFSTVIDLIRKPTNTVETKVWEDFFNDADGLALHRIQVVFFNLLVLYVIWRDLLQLGSVARVDLGWATVMGASAMTFLFGKSGESIRPSIPPVPPHPKSGP